MKKRGFSTIVFLIGVLVVIGFVFAGSAYIKNNKEEILHNASPSPQPTSPTIAISPTHGEGDCSGPNDKSCPNGYKCVQKCGPPVARAEDPPPGYQCLPDDQADK